LKKYNLSRERAADFSLPTAHLLVHERLMVMATMLMRLADIFFGDGIKGLLAAG
jgi:hypothetical protein